MPCLVWLCGLSADLQIERSLIQLLVRAHAWGSWGCARGN